MAHLDISSSTRNTSYLAKDSLRATHTDHYKRNNGDALTYHTKQHELKEVQPLRSYRKDMPYLSGLASNSITPSYEHKKINPFVSEEKMYKEKYYDTLNNQRGFHKKEGYFTEFATRNKIVTDEYKALKQPEHGHSRYISKPVIFTTLKSKNKLSNLVGLDHSQLLEERKNFSFKSSVLINSNSPIRGPQIDLTFCKSDTEPDFNSPILPSVENRGNFQKEKPQLMKVNTTISHCSSPKKRQTSIDANDNERMGSIKSQDYLSSFKINSSLAGKSSPNSTMSKVISESPYKLKSQKINEKSPDIRDPKSLHNLTKYKTKLLSETLFSEYANRSKADPSQYIEHKGEIDYLREANIAVNKMTKDRKFLRNHLSPQSYMTLPQKKVYKDPEAMAELDKFEENILGWVKSVPNFGKQRWTYDKQWEFRLT